MLASFPSSLAVRRCQFARPLDSRTTRTRAHTKPTHMTKSRRLHAFGSCGPRILYFARLATEKGHLSRLRFVPQPILFILGWSKDSRPLHWRRHLRRRAHLQHGTYNTKGPYCTTSPIKDNGRYVCTATVTRYPGVVGCFPPDGVLRKG